MSQLKMQPIAFAAVSSCQTRFSVGVVARGGMVFPATHLQKMRFKPISSVRAEADTYQTRVFAAGAAK
jgi:hypothetical protein